MPVQPRISPQTLRQYALVADGERGALIGPRGDVAFLCAPSWADDAVFSALLGGPGHYVVTPADDHAVWGGYYEPGSLVWHSRWLTSHAAVECEEALAFPADPHVAVLLRRVVAQRHDSTVHVQLDCRAGFGAGEMSVTHREGGVWDLRSGPLHVRWSGGSRARLAEDGLHLELDLRAGESHDLLLEVSDRPLRSPVPDPARLWERTREHWASSTPRLESSAAPSESAHSYAVLRGLTSSTGGMVAAATTSLPERAATGRNYDYRYAWIRDQAMVGQAAAASGADDLLDAAVGFVSERVLDDGPALEPAYTVHGRSVPAQQSLDLPGYPGAPRVNAGNHVHQQFQLDIFGEALLLFAAAESRGRLDGDARAAAMVAADSIAARWWQADAGIWELAPRRWTHSRLMCAAGLRAYAHQVRPDAQDSLDLADLILGDADADSVHPSGRWQRSPEDPRVCASLLLPAIRGAVPAEDPRTRLTWQSVREHLTDDGYVYRYRHDDRPLYLAEGAFLLCGFVMALATAQQGHTTEALRWYERTRASPGPPGLFAEEFDVKQHQLRGNLPQAFVHGLSLETGAVLGGVAGDRIGFRARDT